MLNLRKILSSLTIISASTMLSWKSACAKCSGGDALLDMSEAVKFCEINPVDPNEIGPDADLSIYNRATPDALAFLAKQGYDSFVFLGLESLDRRNAKILATWDVFICFTNLQHLDVEVAAILASCDNAMSFEGMSEIEVDVARELSTKNNLLSFTLDSLSVEVACELARQRHELDFRLKHPPSDQVLNALSNHAGYRLHVSWVRPTGSPPREYCLSKNNKKIFVIPQFIEETGEWLENIYIGDADFFPDSLVSEDGVTFLL